jgi:hypothetical protein
MGNLLNKSALNAKWICNTSRGVNSLSFSLLSSLHLLHFLSKLLVGELTHAQVASPTTRVQILLSLRTTSCVSYIVSHVASLNGNLLVTEQTLTLFLIWIEHVPDQLPQGWIECLSWGHKGKVEQTVQTLQFRVHSEEESSLLDSLLTKSVQVLALIFPSYSKVHQSLVGEFAIQFYQFLNQVTGVNLVQDRYLLLEESSVDVGTLYTPCLGVAKDSGVPFSKVLYHLINILTPNSLRNVTNRNCVVDDAKEFFHSGERLNLNKVDTNLLGMISLFPEIEKSYVAMLTVNQVVRTVQNSYCQNSGNTNLFSRVVLNSVRLLKLLYSFRNNYTLNLTGRENLRKSTNLYQFVVLVRRLDQLSHVRRCSKMFEDVRRCSKKSFFNLS